MHDGRGKQCRFGRSLTTHLITDCPRCRFRPNKGSGPLRLPGSHVIKLGCILLTAQETANTSIERALASEGTTRTEGLVHEANRKRPHAVASPTTGTSCREEAELDIIDEKGKVKNGERSGRVLREHEGRPTSSAQIEARHDAREGELKVRILQAKACYESNHLPVQIKNNDVQKGFIPPMTLLAFSRSIHALPVSPHFSSALN